MFTNQMFENLGYRWANTIFACLATVMVPIPFVRVLNCIALLGVILMLGLF